MTEETEPLLSNRVFQKYFGLSLSATSASSVVSLVIIWYVYSVTHSAIDLTIIGVTETLAAVIISLPAGVWIDRHDRIKLLILSNVVRTSAVALIVVLTRFFGFNLIAIVLLLFAWNGAAELYRSSSYAVLPDLVGSEKLADANGIVRSASNLLRSGSNAIGGALIVVVGASLAFSYGAFGFLIALIFSLSLVGYNKKLKGIEKPANAKKANGLSEIREGLAWLLSQRGLLWLTLSCLIFNFFFTASYYFLVVYVSSGLHAGSLVYGEILASFAIGYAIGSTLVGRARWSLIYAGRVWTLVYGAGVGASLLLMSLFLYSILGILFYFIAGTCAGFAGNVWLTSAQNIVPAEMRGRYFAIDGLISFIGGPPAIAAGGVLVLTIHIIPLYELSGIIMVLSGVGFSLIKSLWMLNGTSPQRVEQK
ncbi:MAG: MFS transporter [Nitrososphaerota archaeon]|nr:MFS transporter [Nitrososphaerota archaeon]